MWVPELHGKTRGVQDCGWKMSQRFGQKTEWRARTDLCIGYLRHVGFVDPILIRNRSKDQIRHDEKCFNILTKLHNRQESKHDEWKGSI
jgi:hypothetical protein